VQLTGSLLKAWAQPPALEHRFRRSYVTKDAPPARTLRDLAGDIAATAWAHASWKPAGGSTCRMRLAWQRIWLAHGLRHTDGELEGAWLWSIGQRVTTSPIIAL